MQCNWLLCHYYWQSNLWCEDVLLFSSCLIANCQCQMSLQMSLSIPLFHLIVPVSSLVLGGNNNIGSTWCPSNAAAGAGICHCLAGDSGGFSGVVSSGSGLSFLPLPAASLSHRSHIPLPWKHLQCSECKWHPFFLILASGQILKYNFLKVSSWWVYAEETRMFN